MNRYNHNQLITVSTTMSGGVAVFGGVSAQANDGAIGVSDLVQ